MRLSVGDGERILLFEHTAALMKEWMTDPGLGWAGLGLVSSPRMSCVTRHMAAGLGIAVSGRQGRERRPVSQSLSGRMTALA